VRPGAAGGTGSPAPADLATVESCWVGFLLVASVDWFGGWRRLRWLPTLAFAVDGMMCYPTPQSIQGEGKRRQLMHISHAAASTRTQATLSGFHGGGGGGGFEASDGRAAVC